MNIGKKMDNLLKTRITNLTAEEIRKKRAQSVKLTEQEPLFEGYDVLKHMGGKKCVIN